MKKSKNNTSIQAASFYSGMLPRANDLEKYNKIIENGANRIMHMAENQQIHRHSLEDKNVSHSIIQSYFGLVIGFLVTISFLIASVYLVINNHETAGTIIGTVDLVGLVSVFVIGVKKKAN